MCHLKRGKLPQKKNIGKTTTLLSTWLRFFAMCIALCEQGFITSRQHFKEEQE